MKFAFTLLTLIAIAAIAKADCPSGVCSLASHGKAAPVIHRQTAEPPVACAACAAPAKPIRGRLFRRR